MQNAFENFVREIEELCGNPGINSKWLDNEDVCLLLNISKRTLQYYRDCDKLPFSIIGKKCYYKAHDIEKLLFESYVKY